MIKDIVFDFGGVITLIDTRPLQRLSIFYLRLELL